MEFLKTLKKPFLIVWLFIFTSCLKVDCEENSKAFREYECLQIFERLPILESPYMESEYEDVDNELEELYIDRRTSTMDNQSTNNIGFWRQLMR